MASRRREIRRRARDLLLGKTDAGARVYSNAASAAWAEEFPIVIVYSRAESVEDLGVAPLEYRRTLELAVEVIASGSEDPSDSSALDDVLDEITAQVEKVFGRDDTLGEVEDPLGKKVAMVDSLKLRNVEFDYQADGAKPIGSAIMLWEAVYHEFQPGSIEEQDGIGTLERVHAEWGFGAGEDPPNETFDISDDVEIPS